MKGYFKRLIMQLLQEWLIPYLLEHIKSELDKQQKNTVQMIVHHFTNELRKDASLRQSWSDVDDMISEA